MSAGIACRFKLPFGESYTEQKPFNMATLCGFLDIVGGGFGAPGLFVTIYCSNQLLDGLASDTEKSQCDFELNLHPPNYS